ncbi:hypothetical protein AB0K05_24995 [Nonomuraea sp. NPDC049486]|uniref:hypothetical protein n=1 Tax=Nonomuraea sp. NPDC049486 TaxID=3155773 RepID=UPI00342984C8
MSLSDWLVSWLRTNVAAWIPSVAAWLASYGIDLPVEPSSVVLVSLAVSVYYTLVRLLETAWPAAGLLLGYRAAPTYQALSGGHPGVHAGRDLHGL